MKTLNLDESAPFSFENKNFFLLGKTDSSNLSKETDEKIRVKFKNKNNTDIPIGEIWATLGWANPDFKSKLKGKLEFSTEGNTESKSYLKPIFDDIKYINPAVKGQLRPVTERFINFKKVTFNWNPESFAVDEIPELRITVYLKKGETAIACYQYGDINNDEDLNAEFEFIQPKDFLENRDRIDFIFPILPENELEAIENIGETRFRFNNNRKRKTSFLIKVFTFQTVAGNEDQVFEAYKNNIIANARGASNNAGFLIFGKDKYALLNYDKIHRDFVKVQALPIDFSKKTLLLIHGTFVDTDKTFGTLFEPSANYPNSLLNQLLDDGIFEQIIGFNYPTISHDAKDNALNLYEMLSGKKFALPVSIIGSSRGCLLAKYLTCDKENIIFKADKVIMFSGANGVGYFDFAGKYIPKFLTILAKTSGPTGKIIFGFLNFSAKYFLNQPGSKLMTPGSESLKELLAMRPVDPATEYYNVVSDWDTSLPHRFFGNGLDLLIRGIMKGEHDWVVGCKEQAIYFNSEVNSIQPKTIVSMHARYFDISYTPHDTHKEIYDYFNSNMNRIS